MREVAFKMRLKVYSIVCLFLVCSVLALSCCVGNVDAAPSLYLSFYKNNGYGMGDDMNGLWTVNTDVSGDVVYVEFYLDDQLQQNDTSAPFSWPFDTSNYTEGSHAIKAIAYDSSGDTATAVAEHNFVEFSPNFVVGIIVLVVVVLVVSLVVALFWVRKKEAKQKQVN